MAADDPEFDLDDVNQRTEEWVEASVHSFRDGEPSTSNPLENVAQRPPSVDGSVISSVRTLSSSAILEMKRRSKLKLQSLRMRIQQNYELQSIQRERERVEREEESRHREEERQRREEEELCSREEKDRRRKLDEMEKAIRFKHALHMAELEVNSYEEDPVEVPLSVPLEGLGTAVTQTLITKSNEPSKSVPSPIKPRKLVLKPEATPFEPKCRCNCANTSSVVGEVRELSVSDLPVCALPEPQPSTSNQRPVKKDSRLPPPQISKFAGDPMEYHAFIRSFKCHIAEHVSDDDVRLSYLQQFCVGDANDLIKHCSMLSGEGGYAEALKLLKENYGKDHIIARTCLNQLQYGPKLRSEDVHSMQKFARLMKTCQVVLSQIEGNAGLDTFQNLLAIVRRLSSDMQEQWDKEVARIIKTYDREPNFDDLTEFVDNQAAVASSSFRRAHHPVRETPSGQRKNRAATYVVSSELPGTEAPQARCLFCTGLHDLTTCNSFEKKPVYQRYEFARRQRLCFKCLQKGHNARDCKEEDPCKISGCDSNSHHTLLHREVSRAEANRSSAPEEKVTSEVNSFHLASDSKPSAICGNTSICGDMYMNIVPVRARNGNIEFLTYAFLDSGATKSMCSQRLVDALHLQGESRTVSLRTVGHEQTMPTKIVSLSVAPAFDDGPSINLNSVMAIDKLPVKTNKLPSKTKLKRMSYLRGLEFPQIEGGEVTLMIGVDAPELMVFQETRCGSREQPIAVKTALGWSLLGPSFVPTSGTRIDLNYVSSFDDNVSKEIDCLWRTDFSDLTIIDDKRISREDRSALEIMKRDVLHVDGHYQLPLLWKGNQTQLPPNRVLAERRLRSLERRLKKDEKLRERYVGTVETYIQKGYAKRISSHDRGQSKREWYLPHHPVLHPRKPDKVRVVFDCAAKHAGVALNDALMSGPDLMNNLVGVLTRFRKEPVAVVSDIESMFHQIRVRPEDTASLRFLWWPKGDLSKPAEDHEMTVHLFGATSSPSCAAFSLLQTAEEFGHEFSAAATTALKSNFYVDDCLASVATEDEAIMLVKDLGQLLQRGGFHLTKWMSNSNRVLQSIPSDERSKMAKNHDLNSDVAGRILGVFWNVPNDEFGFDVQMPNKSLTRRGILSAVSALYDPLGLVAPVTVSAKILLQDLCRQGLGWDEDISNEDANRWRSWMEGLPMLSQVRVQRCIKPPSFGKIVKMEMHHFADASSSAYGAVSYLRLVNHNTQVHCCFLLGKSRLAPIHTVSIPRLELTAAVLAVKMDGFLRRELGCPDCESTFWTDSMSVLMSIRNSTKRFETFVANRLAKIDSGSRSEQWRHVPSKLNPADDASRGLSVKKMVNNNVWLTGPRFLWGDESTWPKEEEVSNRDDILMEAKKVSANFTCGTACETDSISKLINHYSDWNRLRRATAWLLRYKRVLLSKRCADTNTTIPKGTLQVQELQEAELALFRIVQQQAFPEVLENLRKGNGQWKKTKNSRTFDKLGPTLSNGLLRVGGRLELASISDDAKHPIILPGRHHLTDLLIVKFHKDVGHSGMSHTWSEIRQKFWIIKGGAAVRRVLGNCVFCRKRNAPVGEQLMARLPIDRVNSHSPAFTYVGVDYFGPLMVRQARSQVKVYGCLFTCMTVRAVHLEVADSLSTSAFINCLRRFIGRRGRPTKICSDNGTNFVGAVRELKEAIGRWNQQSIDDFLRQQDIQWSFNPPAASHMGGVWERMIRSVRRVLSALLTAQSVTRDTLETVLVEAESILNSRPIVPVVMDPQSDEPLTPNHLILLRPSPNMPPGVFVKKDCYVRHHWRQVQYLADQFWRRWVREYLPTVIERQKWFSKQRNVEAGDLVLVVDESIPRARWRIGRVISTFPDAHGVVRSALVGTGATSVRRPITKLCLVMDSRGDCATGKL
uniref:Uncharacterized protein LOC104265735 n=1 Tax=Phallusia mammillata TaxID=59560 RepID=A0A6F9DJF9_9ASCI|nr:uncharacterized protein LOC104265735 [Phallusia mammillata]